MKIVASADFEHKPNHFYCVLYRVRYRYLTSGTDMDTDTVPLYPLLRWTSARGRLSDSAPTARSPTLTASCPPSLQSGTGTVVYLHCAGNLNFLASGTGIMFRYLYCRVEWFLKWANRHSLIIVTVMGLKFCIYNPPSLSVFTMCIQ